jgi:hypothetical protein
MYHSLDEYFIPHPLAISAKKGKKESSEKILVIFFVLWK